MNDFTMNIDLFR